MDKETNNPNLEPWQDPALEARIVADLLGETSPFEKSELQSQLDSNPDLKAFQTRLKQTHQTLQKATTPTTTAQPNWKLPKEKRTALLKKLAQSESTPTPPQQKHKPLLRRLAPTLAVAAAIILLLAGSLITLTTNTKYAESAPAKTEIAPTVNLSKSTRDFSHFSRETPPQTDGYALSTDPGITGDWINGMDEIDGAWFNHETAPLTNDQDEVALQIAQAKPSSEQAHLASGRSFGNATRHEKFIDKQIDLGSNNTKELAKRRTVSAAAVTDSTEESLGFGIAPKESAPQDNHGTEMAGIIIAGKDNGLGLLTDNFQAKLAEPKPSTPTSEIAAAPQTPRSGSSINGRFVTDFDSDIPFTTTVTADFGWDSNPTSPTEPEPPKLPALASNLTTWLAQPDIATRYSENPNESPSESDLAEIEAKTFSRDTSRLYANVDQMLFDSEKTDPTNELQTQLGDVLLGSFNIPTQPKSEFFGSSQVREHSSSTIQKPSETYRYPGHPAGITLSDSTDQSKTPNSNADLELARRLERTRSAEEDIKLATKLASAGELEESLTRYRSAVDKLPNAPMTEQLRTQAIDGLADTTVDYADELAKQGRFAEARARLDFTLSKNIAPENDKAKTLLTRIDSPEYYNPATTPDHTKNVQEIERLQRLAEGYYDIGRYDNAEKQLNQILRIDKYDEGARTALEKVETARQQYYKTARDHMRGAMLSQVDERWEWAVPQISFEDDESSKVNTNTASGGAFWDITGVDPEIAAPPVLETEAAGEEFYRWSDPSNYVGQRAWGGHGGVRLFSNDVQYFEGLNEIHDTNRAYFAPNRTITDLRDITEKQLQKQRDESRETELGNIRQKIANQKAATPRPKAKPAPTNETLTKTEPFSTFSLNVSDVSFKLAKTALLENNTFPEAAKIRTEEFVNAFDYGDPQPSLEEKIACQIDQATHPFLQQRNFMRVSMSTAAAGRASTQPLRLTILLDKSGSMERADREESVLRTMQALAQHLGPADQISAIAFARQPRLIADQLTGDRADQLAGLVAATPSEGGTNLEEALKLADTLATRQFEDNAINRIILITDGAANLGDANPESLKQKVIALRQRGIAFDACGVGADGLNDTTLEALTRKGDGRYYLLDRPQDADEKFIRQLAGSLRPAAKNIKVQVQFNPSRVTSYRLLGFEKHRLEKQDFRNDKVDAAEIAAAESGNALYHFQADPQGTGDIGQVSVRFLDTATNKMVERTWPIPYQEKAPRLEEATQPIQLAATAALLAEKLKGDSSAKGIQLPDLTPVLNQLRTNQDPNTQALIQMVEKARSLTE